MDVLSRDDRGLLYALKPSRAYGLGFRVYGSGLRV